MTTQRSKIIRQGTTYLEIQVAMVLLALSAAGLYSVSVVQTRQTARLNNRVFNEFADRDAAINPSTNRWARKLGVLARMEETVNAPIPIEPDTFFQSITDDSDTANTSSVVGVDRFFDWFPFNTSAGFNNDATFYFRTRIGFGGGRFDSFIRNVPPGNYEILITHPASGSLGRNVLYQVFDGNSLIASRSINQRIAPSEVNYAGDQWKSIGVATINSGTVRIRVNDGPNGQTFVVADAVAIRSRKLELQTLSETPSGGATATLEFSDG